MDKMNQCPHIKGHYLMMDNAPIHTSVDIAKYVNANQGNWCVDVKIKLKVGPNMNQFPG